MTVMPVAERMTAEQYLALGEPPEGRRRTELIDGEVVVSEALPLHSYVVSDVRFALEAWTRAQSGRGRVMDPLDVQLDDHNVFVPDVLWYAEGRAPARDAGRPSLMPDLAVEVRSPSTWRYDIGAKKAAYERHGLPELWLVDTPAEQVLVFRRSRSGAARFDVTLELAGDDVLASPPLSGFELTPDDLFQTG